MPAVQYVETILDLVGDTPLVRLDKVTEGLRPTVLAKLEQLNPGGSVKDRIGLTMIEEAERAGQLRPGGTIVEPTSGNTGVGLAIVAQQKGYKCVFVCPDKVSTDKINVLRAYGADVVVCPYAVAPEHLEILTKNAGSLLEMTTELSSFSSNTVDASQFEVPAGFKKVDSDMKKMR